MHIIIIGAGAMGLLYGAYLSQENQVTLVCTNQAKADSINQKGVTVWEKDGSSNTYHPKAVVSSQGLAPADYVILLVKASGSQSALENNKHLFTPKTTLLTLQNGAGHEDLLSQYVSKENLAIGISQDGSFLLSPHQIRHTGSAMTYFGKPMGDTETMSDLEKSCHRCGFQTEKSANIKFFIWEKLIINASSSVMSGVLQMEQGYCYTNPSAWGFVQSLVAEMVQVACGDGIPLDYPTQIARLEQHLTTNPEGVPSIAVDIKDGRLTEVDTISGSVVRAGQRLAIPTPTHSMIVNLVHALESRPTSQNPVPSIK